MIDISALGLTLNRTGIVNNSSVSQTITVVGVGHLFDQMAGRWPMRTF